MTTIKEDYVSFETAKLLKEKGFPLPSTNFKDWAFCMYDKNGDIQWGCYSSEWYVRVTLQMAMKWLREVHNLYIDIRININDSLYSFKIYSVGVSGARAFTEYRIKSYEAACEEAIKYCLENLI